MMEDDKMFCPKCGEAIQDSSTVCIKCGTDLSTGADGQTVVYASQKEPEIIGQPNAKKKISKKVIIGSAFVVCIIAVILIVSVISSAILKNALVKEWYDIDGSIIKVLDIDEDKMETSLGTYEWKAISGNKIKIKRFNDKFETFTIEFNDEKTMLKISPAITSVDDSETWYHIDK